MIGALLTIMTFISVAFFPWPLATLLALLAAAFEPLVPLAAGLFADTLYYTPSGAHLPLFTLFGLLATIIAFFVHSGIRSNIIS